MRKFELMFFRTYSTILALLLTLLGFTQSSCAKLYGSPIAEYGTPSAKFIVIGKVESSGTNQPIKNILVYMSGDSTFTDSTGRYQLHSGGFPNSQTFPIRFHDVDGILQGEYTNLDTIVEFKDPQFTNGDGHWYYGETSKEFDIQLKPKK